MPALTAKFSLSVSPEISVLWPDASVPKLTFTSNLFQVNISLVLTPPLAFIEESDRAAGKKIRAIEVMLTRDEQEAAPDISYGLDGTRNLAARSDYFGARLDAYRRKAVEVANQVLQFFQYSLSTPLVRPIVCGEKLLENPIWYDPLGNAFESGFYSVVLQFTKSEGDKLHGVRFTPNHISALTDHLQSPREPSLAQTLLSDAQAAWFEKNLRRAVLELAICTELMVKRTFFAKASPAGAAFDYLEDKARVSVRVLELLDVIAEEAFSRNYRKENGADYQYIDQLFRCRNKIAHRGELVFRDDRGATVQVDAKTVGIWWLTVASLKDWLETLS